MPLYLVVEPVTYTNPNGSVTSWREAGHMVELSAETAAEAGGALKLISDTEAQAVVAKASRPRGKRGTKAAEVGVLDNPADEVAEPAGVVVSPFPAPEAAPGTTELPPGGDGSG